jgi:inosine/xanthosine triphosphate pyrophosphatase family protein
MAELSAEQKDAISHRGRAARALLEWLEGATR